MNIVREVLEQELERLIDIGNDLAVNLAEQEEVLRFTQERICQNEYKINVIQLHLNSFLDEKTEIFQPIPIHKS